MGCRNIFILKVLAAVFFLFSQFKISVLAEGRPAQQAPAQSAVQNQNRVINTGGSLEKTEGNLKSVSQVLEQYKGEDTRKVIIIVDYHAHFNSQLNSARMVHELLSREGIGLVGIEGGIGELDPVRFRSIENERVRKNVTEIFTKAGYLSGPEYYAALAGTDLKLAGLEDAKMYSKNLEEFRQVYRLMQEGGEKDLKEIKEALEGLQKKIWSGELREFMFLTEGYHMNQVDADAYTGGILKFAKRYGIGINSGSELGKVGEIDRLGHLIHKEKFSRELELISGELKRKMSLEDQKDWQINALNYRMKQNSAGEYFGWLEKKAVAYGEDVQGKYPNFLRFVKRLKLRDSLLTSRMDKEADEITEKILHKMTQDEKGWNLVNLTRSVRFTENLTHLNLKHEEWEKIKKGLDIGEIAGMLRKLGVKLGELEKLEETIEAAKNFYQTAIERDKILLEKMLNWMKEKGEEKGILFCGGFHSEGIGNRLREKKISYELMVPLVEGDRNNEAYMNTMLEENGVNLKGVWQALENTGVLMYERLLTEEFVTTQEAGYKQNKLERALITVRTALEMADRMKEGETAESVLNTVRNILERQSGEVKNREHILPSFINALQEGVNLVDKAVVKEGNEVLILQFENLEIQIHKSGIQVVKSAGQGISREYLQKSYPPPEFLKDAPARLSEPSNLDLVESSS